MGVNGSSLNPRREIDQELDKLDTKIEKLRMLYEQHFVGVLPVPPADLRREVVMDIRRLFNAPFKRAASSFRLKMLHQRYQTYSTYWERVQKERDEGTYCRDVYKADMREKTRLAREKAQTGAGKAEKGLRELYKTYETAVRKQGGTLENINFDSFKKSLVNQAKNFKKKHGANKLHYKIVVKGGKVVVKASMRD